MFYDLIINIMVKIKLEGIDSVKDAKKAIKKAIDTWKVTEKTLSFLVQAFGEMKENKKDSRETVENVPELEKKNFRVKNTKNRKEFTDSDGVKFKVNREKDIREYVDWKHEWEQLFTEESILRETSKVGKKLPLFQTYRDIVEKKYKWKYKDSLKGEAMTFPGWRGPNERFANIGKAFVLHCADGGVFYYPPNRSPFPLQDGDHSSYWFSARCLKD